MFIVLLKCFFFGKISYLETFDKFSMLYPLMKEIVNTPPHVVRNLSNCLVDELLLYKLLAFSKP